MLKRAVLHRACRVAPCSAVWLRVAQWDAVWRRVAHRQTSTKPLRRTREPAPTPRAAKPCSQTSTRPFCRTHRAARPATTASAA
eukprot:gene12459-biopygen9719